MQPAPTKFHGWTLAWMLGLTQMVSWGILYYGFGVVLPRMQAETGWSSAEAALAFSIATIVSALVAIPLGRRLDARGPRLTMTAGSIAAAALLIAWSQVQSLAALYAVFVGLGAVMAMVLYDPAFWIVAQWFSGEWARRRGRALTIVTFWGGLASTAFIPLANALIERFGWRSALIVLALVLAACTIPAHAWFLRHQPVHLGPRRASAAPTGALRGAARMRSFWLVMLAFALTNLATGVAGVHFITFQLARGQEAGVAAAAAGMVGVLQVVGRLTFAPLGDRVPRRLITAGMCALMAVGLAGLVSLSAWPSLAAYVVLYGLGHGALTPMRAALTADIFGIAAYGEINGAISLTSTFARGIAPAAAGVMIAGAGGFDAAWWAVAIGCALAAVAVLSLRE